MNTITDRDPIISYDAPSGRHNLLGQQRPQMLRNWAARIESQENYRDAMIESFISQTVGSTTQEQIDRVTEELSAYSTAYRAALASYLADPEGWKARHRDDSLGQEWRDYLADPEGWLEAHRE